MMQFDAAFGGERGFGHQQRRHRGVADAAAQVQVEGFAVLADGPDVADDLVVLLDLDQTGDDVELVGELAGLAGAGQHVVQAVADAERGQGHADAVLGQVQQRAAHVVDHGEPALLVQGDYDRSKGAGEWPSQIWRDACSG
ncbi:hypothetical protein [Nonomuraea solani]|uniref:hypothetical protein n=1 Tax=Nonomuraea solani TaxID=1144553 RepID=UPI001F3AEE59|nr:hypothetical protein [Nonomuraea solani]